MTLDQQSPAVSTKRGQHLGGFLPAIVGVAVVAVGCLAWAILGFGSLRNAWLYANGVRVMIEPTTATILDEGRRGL